MTSQPFLRHSRRAARPHVAEHEAPLTRHHDGWQAFLNQANASDPRLCHLLAKFGAPLRRAAKGAITDGTPGFPWVTPVLGSGCLSEPDAEQLASLRSKPASFAACLREDDLPGGDIPSALVFNFTRSLLEQRVQELHGQPFPDDPQDPTADDKATADCVLAAALVHRAWHEAAGMATGLTRSRDPLSLNTDQVRGQEVVVASLEPARQRLAAVDRHLSATPTSSLDAMRPAIGRVLALLDNQLAGTTPRLTGHDVQGLVEIAWLMMITPEGLYPGWRDLMTSTSLMASRHRQMGTSGRGLDFAHPRPALQDVEEAAHLTAELASLRSATTRSWRDRQAGRTVNGAPPPRVALYDAVADLLISQLAYGNTNSPVPAAFVASMDVELEMSLIRKKQKFTVLVPYHFSYGEDGTDPRAMLFWLAGTIDPAAIDIDGDLDLSLLDVHWRDAPDAVTRAVDTMVVVRLVGSPLLPKASGGEPLFVKTLNGLKRTSATVISRLAALAAATAKTDAATFDEVYPQQWIVPAYLLDEYSGLHQLASVVQGSLAQNLVDLTPTWFYRFWLAVGVPFDDVLVRLLVASHIDTSTGPRGLLEHHGVMVNRQVSKAEADLLAWQGFDAVHSTFASVVPDVEHYAAHMLAEASDTGSTFTERGVCDIRVGDVEVSS